jgi:hypothetical protein
MLVVSVARQLGSGNSFTRLLCCPAQAERAGERRLGSVKLTMPAEELTGPADAAFEEGKPQFREPPGDAAQKDRLGGRMPGRSEMANVAITETGRRQAQAPVEAGTVKRRRDAEFDAFRPYGAGPPRCARFNTQLRSAESIKRTIRLRI